MIVLFRRFGLVLIPLLGFFGAAATALAQASPPGTAPIDDYRYAGRQITARSHMLAQPVALRRSPSSNVAIFEQSDGFIVVDTGNTPAFGRQIVDYISARSNKPVTAIVLTHFHSDHVLGVAPIRERWPGAILISSTRTRERLAADVAPNVPMRFDPENYRAFVAETQSVLEQFRTSARDPALSPEERAGSAMSVRDVERVLAERNGAYLILPDVTFDRSLVLHDAELPLEIRFLGRANTDGDIIVWSPTDRVVATGDTVVLPIPFGFGSFAEDWLTVLAQLQALDFAHLIPGHGPVQSDSGYLALLAETIVELRRQVAALGTGLTNEQIYSQVDLSAYRSRFAGDDQWKARLFDSFWVRPMARREYQRIHSVSR